MNFAGAASTEHVFNSDSGGRRVGAQRPSLHFLSRRGSQQAIENTIANRARADLADAMHASLRSMGRGFFDAILGDERPASMQITRREPVTLGGVGRLRTGPLPLGARQSGRARLTHARDEIFGDFARLQTKPVDGPRWIDGWEKVRRSLGCGAASIPRRATTHPT